MYDPVQLLRSREVTADYSDNHIHRAGEIKVSAVASHEWLTNRKAKSCTIRFIKRC